MELKDMILSTLAELDTEEESVKEEETPPMIQETVTPLKKEESKEKEVKEEPLEVVEDNEDPSRDEEAFLSNVRERVLVLFEGFQSPNNKNLDAKVDLTLNFLEYLLATIDDRMEKIKS